MRYISNSIETFTQNLRKIGGAMPKPSKSGSSIKATQDTVRTDRATLFYRIRGSGALLLILPGGDGDADTADALCDELIDRYTVVTYDRRGMSRSAIDASTKPPTIATHSDDVHRLLATLTNEPAFVFASSIGALIGLDLIARNPEQVRILIAHEPPAWELLPVAERDQATRSQEDAEEAFRREGADAGFKKFVALAAVDFSDREPDAALAPPTSERAANLSYFFTHDSPAVRRHRLNLAALEASAARIVPAVGQSAAGSAPYRVAAALAARLGKDLVEFPGGHTGWLLRPKAFATKLREIFQ
jgi:pimeloyl-ACP methyl ester carboxylesterase